MSFANTIAQWAQSLYDNADAQPAQGSAPNPFDTANTGQSIPTFTPSSWIQNFVDQQPTTPAPVPTLDTSMPAPFKPAPLPDYGAISQEPGASNTEPVTAPSFMSAMNAAYHPTGNDALDTALSTNLS